MVPVGLQVGFVTSSRLLFFWGIMFTAGIWGLSLFMIVAVLAKHLEVTQVFLVSFSACLVNISP